MGYVISEDCIPCIPKKEYCYGSRYNFKKGMEHCSNSKECQHYKNLIELYENKEHRDVNVQTIFFYNVKDFRKCTKYLEMGVYYCD
jgi:hypothetical protein